MDYQNLVRDFAIRTKQNLEFIRQVDERNEYQVFEVTQLINSMLGLLVFPKEHYWDKIPEISIDEMKDTGWPIPQLVGDSPQISGLRDLVRYLRNAIAHFHIEFVADPSGRINGVRVKNIYRQEVIWHAELSITDLEIITIKFIDLLEN